VAAQRHDAACTAATAHSLASSRGLNLYQCNSLRCAETGGALLLGGRHDEGVQPGKFVAHRGCCYSHLCN
jgi:hypothetical protein